MPTPSPRGGPPCGGYTLVELVVAASLLGLAISGVMSMIGSGRQFELENNLRRQARIVASSMLEDTLYHFSRFAALSLMTPETIENISLMADSVTAVPATTRLAIGGVIAARWYDIPTGGHSGDIPYRRIGARVSWDWAGKPDSVSIWKTIAEAESN